MDGWTRAIPGDRGTLPDADILVAVYVPDHRDVMLATYADDLDAWEPEHYPACPVDNTWWTHLPAEED